MPAAPADRDPDAAVEAHSSIRPACRQPTHPGVEDRIALNRNGRPAEAARTPNQKRRAVGKRDGGDQSMLSGRKVPYRAAKLVVAGSMLALAASLAGAQQPQAPAPAAPAAPVAPAPQAAPAPAAPQTPAAPQAPAAQNAPAIVPPVPA